MKKSDIINIILLIFFRIVIEYIYIDFLSTKYGYLGLSLDYNIIKSFESYLLMIFVYFIIDKRKKRPSSILLQILFILSIVPLLSIYGLKNESRTAVYLSLLGFLIPVIVVRIFPRIKLMRVKKSKLILYLLIGGLTSLTYLLLLKDNGIPSLTAFNFSTIYSFRSKVVYNAFTTYSVPWQARVINIFLIAVFYLKKEYKKMVLPIFLQIVLFLITAHKSYLFSPVAVLGLLYIISRKNLLSAMISALTALNILAFLSYKFNFSVWPVALITHRQHYIPAQISFYFFDFFSKNDKLYFSEGVIGKILGLSSPYNISSFKMIGDHYFGRPEMHANTWYVADAYANGGIIGILIIGLILAFTLIIADSIKRDYKIVLVALFMPILSLTNGALLTAFFTNGLLISLIILIVYSNQPKRNRQTSQGEKNEYSHDINKFL